MTKVLKASLKNNVEGRECSNRPRKSAQEQIQKGDERWSQQALGILWGRRVSQGLSGKLHRMRGEEDPVWGHKRKAKGVLTRKTRKGTEKFKRKKKTESLRRKKESRGQTWRNKCLK